ncbi:MAG TPA: hypothetical protein VMV10_16150 [Pirellulales bacterium]|nr:hypothetical protein [Pirellulales bacterium]
MSDPIFDELQAATSQKGLPAATARIAARLLETEHYHELFDLRLLEARLRLGLPAVLTKSLDDLKEPVRSQMEEEYLKACREVGHLFLRDGRVREAWMYLRPLGEQAEVAAALENLTPDEENTEQIIEVALHEGVCPRLGFKLVLKNYGVCNAISMFDAQMHNRPKSDRQQVAALLVRQLHGDLFRTLQEEISRKQGKPPQEQTIEGLVAERDWLLDDNNYHIDTSHLAAVVRFALVIDDPADLRLAADLTEYGRRLSPMYQFAGQEPFVDSYPTHALFFRALLGEQVEEAAAYFRERAEQLAETDQAAAPAEIYVALLARLGRHAEALDASAALLSNVRVSGFAPSLLELSQRTSDYRRLLEVSRASGDLVTFAMALAEQQRQDDAECHGKS